MGLPAGISLQDIEAFAKDNPDLYRVLAGIGRTLNDLLAYASKTADAPSSGFPPPAGPRNLSVASVGSTVIVTWINDSSPQSIVGYKVFRAAAGTRSAPTTPTFVDGKFIGSMLATDVCLGTAGSVYKYVDRDFAIANLDQANPSRFSYWVTSLDSDGQESSTGVLAANSPIEVVPNGPGDQSSDVKNAAQNKLYNASFTSRATASSLTMPYGDSVAAATNASPIQITSSASHGMVTGDDVVIAFCVGNTAANGYWKITKIDNTHFTLDGSTGNGVLTSGGSYWPAMGGGQPPGIQDQQHDFAHSPWFVEDATGFAVAKLYSNGSQATGEVQLVAPTAGHFSLIKQNADGILTPGARLVFSVYMRMPTPATDMTITVSMGGNTPVSKSFSSSLLTSTHQRVVFNGAPSNFTGGFRVTIKVATNSGTGQDVFLFKPMLNFGDVPAGWTASVDAGVVAGISYETTPPWGRITPTLIFRDSTAPYV